MPRVAVIGASADRAKFGNKAVRSFLDQGWDVHPVNPNAREVEGLACVASLRDVPRPVDRVLLYLPPDVGLGVLEDVAAVQPGEFWVNPGAESDALIARARELGLQPILACAIVGIGDSPARWTA